MGLMRKHDNILDVCEERFIVKDKLLVIAWIVGLSFIGGISTVFGFIYSSQKEIEKIQDNKIESFERSIPAIDTKLDILIRQGEERNKMEKINRIRSGLEKP